MFEDIMRWFRSPFDNRGSAVNWVLFVGLLIIAAWFWHMILLGITSEV